MGLLSHCVIYTLKDERQMKKVDMKNKKYAEGFSLKQPQGWQANVVDEEYIISIFFTTVQMRITIVQKRTLSSSLLRDEPLGKYWHIICILS